MKVKASSWHWRLYNFFEGEPSPTVCKYVATVTIVPIFCAVLAPLFLAAYPLVLLGKKVDVYFARRRKGPLCPFGRVDVDRERPADAKVSG